MIADLFSVLKTTFSTVRKQQTLNFSYHESSRCQFSQENQRGLKAFRTDNLPKRSVGCPCLGGRQGSNACALIAVQFGAYCLKNNLDISFFWGKLSQIWTECFTNAICDGNSLYDELYEILLLFFTCKMQNDFPALFEGFHSGRFQKSFP